MGRTVTEKYRSSCYCPHCKQEFTDMDTVDSLWVEDGFAENAKCYECGKDFWIIYTPAYVEYEED